MECCPDSVTSSTEQVESKSNMSTTSSSSSSEMNRGNWGHKLDFFLSCVGYAVGLGNLWRFPYLCMRNGGGAFLIPYFIFLFLCGIPLFFMELSLGQFASLSPMSIWKICPLFSGVGYGMVLVSGLVCVYYNIILAWAVYYIAKSFTSNQLPWATCGNWWNTEHCVTRFLDDLQHTVNTTAVNSTLAPYLASDTNSTLNETLKNVPASEEFWHYNVLQISSGIEEPGRIRWELFLSLLLAWVVVFFCMCKGIKTSGKVVYVTAIAPYIMLIVFLVRGCTLPGAVDGIKFYLYPDFNRLLDFQVWGEACAQIFYSLGPAYGSLITMASYNKFNNNCYRDALIIPVINCGTSFVTGFAIFSVVGFMAKESGVPVSEVITSGPGLAFVAYPEALTKLPISPLWAIIFFLMLFILGLDTQFGMFECLVSGFIDFFPQKLLKRKSLFTAAMCSVQLLAGIPLVTQGGIYLFQIFDWYSATFSLMSIAFLECMILAWLYGAGRVYDDIEMMIGYKPMVWWRICWKYITPFVLLTVLMFTIATFNEPTYGEYTYPPWAIALGWMLALSSLMPIPLVMVYKLCTTEGTVMERLRYLTKPAEDWGPALKKNRVGPMYGCDDMDVDVEKRAMIVLLTASDKPHSAETEALTSNTDPSTSNVV